MWKCANLNVQVDFAIMEKNSANFVNSVWITVATKLTQLTGFRTSRLLKLLVSELVLFSAICLCFFFQKMLRLLLVGIMCLFFVLYVGMEVSYGLYIATFAVESQLNLSKSDGAYITAIFWGCFAAMRFVAIFAAVKMRPIYIMVVSFAFCLLGAVPLAFWAETSPTLLKVKPLLKLNKKYWHG